jgi:hypothetical protein
MIHDDDDDDDVYDLQSTSSSNRVYQKQIHTVSQLFVALPTVLKRAQHRSIE